MAYRSTGERPPRRRDDGGDRPSSARLVLRVASILIGLLAVGWYARPWILRTLHAPAGIGQPCSETVACMKGAECMVVGANVISTIGATSGVCLVRCTNDEQCGPQRRCSTSGGFCGIVSTEGGECSLLTLCPVGMDCLRAPGDPSARCLRECHEDGDCSEGMHCTPMLTDTSGIPVNTTGVGIESRSYCVL